MHKTIQRKEILKLVKESQNHFTADEIYRILAVKVKQLSLGTVYRNLEFLSARGLIRKVMTISSQKKFESNLKMHFHLRCVLCESLTDIDYRILAELDRKITEKATELSCNEYHLEFIYTCNDCKAKLAEKEKKANKKIPLSLI